MPSKPRTAKKAAQQTELKTWDQYVTEAQHEPFLLPVSADETLTITCPDGAAVRALEVARAQQDFDLTMVSLFGEHSERVIELGAKAPHGALADLMLDVMVHFELAERAPDGGDGGPGESSASSS